MPSQARLYVSESADSVYMIWQPARLTAVRSTIYMYNQDNATAYQSPICWGFTHIPAPYQFLKLVKCDVAVFWGLFYLTGDAFEFLWLAQIPTLTKKEDMHLVCDLYAKICV